MNKKQMYELLRTYEDIILDFSFKIKWLLKQNKTVKYRMAVWNSIHEKSIKELEKAHNKLHNYTGHKLQ